jgi:hypothetical protein
MEFILLILTYVFYSLGMDTISRRRGLAHPWISWIPFVNCFQLGCISDHYKQTRIGRRGIMRWVLLILGFINAVVIGGLILLYLIIFFQGVLGAVTVGILFLDEGFMLAIEQNAELFWMTFLFSPLLCLPYWVAKLVAQYQLYKSCRPDVAVVFLLLNIFLPFVTPILIMICKDRDDGMVQEYLY